MSETATPVAQEITPLKLFRKDETTGEIIPVVIEITKERVIVRQYDDEQLIAKQQAALGKAPIVVAGMTPRVTHERNMTIVRAGGSTIISQVSDEGQNVAQFLSLDSPNPYPEHQDLREAYAAAITAKQIEAEEQGRECKGCETGAIVRHYQQALERRLEDAEQQG